MISERPIVHPALVPRERWVRVTDFVGLLLLAAGIAIALSGGFRTHIAGALVSITRPYGVLAAAAFVIALRHWSTRRPTMYDHLAARTRAASRAASFRSAAGAVLTTRPVIFAVGYLAVVMVGYAPGAQPFKEFSTELQNLPLRWDAGWYLRIAVQGYEYVPSDGSLQQNIVFFPAYPMLVRIIGLVCGNTIGAYVGAATAISIAAFLIALAYLYELARQDLPDDQSAAALWLLAAYPFSLFYGAIYTESLFLLGVVAAFYHFRRGEYRASAAFGVLVGLTRPNGLFLSAPLALAALLDRKIIRTSTRPSRRMLAAIGAAAAPAIGAAIYSTYIWSLTGSPIAWATGHAAWGRQYGSITRLVVTRYGLITSQGVLQYVSSEPYDMVNALGVIFVLASCWIVARRFGLPYTVFILVNILPPLAAGGLMSMGRLTSVMFPAFLALAAIVPAAHRIGWITSFVAMQALLAVLFYTWRPLF